MPLLERYDRDQMSLDLRNTALELDSNPALSTVLARLWGLHLRTINSAPLWANFGFLVVNSTITVLIVNDSNELEDISGLANLDRS